MADLSNPRKSGKQPRSNRKYSRSPLWEAQTQAPMTENEPKRVLDHEVEDDIRINQTDSTAENGRIANEASDASGGAFPDENSDNEAFSSEDPGSSPDIEESPCPAIRKRSGTKWNEGNKKRKFLQKNDEHCRGLVEQRTHIHGRESVLMQMFGPHKEDWLAVLRSRDQWSASPTLPNRGFGVKRIGGMRHFFAHTEDMRNMEGGAGWDWYYSDGGRELFNQRQKTQTLSPNDGVIYTPKASKPTSDILMGPYGRQKLFSLPHLKYLGLDEAWKAQLESTIFEVTEPVKKSREKREGWILNAGTCIRCLAWAQNQAQTQYLAISTSTLKSPENSSKSSPAFTPSSDPLRSSIQLWAFEPRLEHDFGYLDSERVPHLQLVICTDWGDAKQLKWCPVPRISRDEDSLGITPISLLAGIWTDGYVRVLNIHIEKKSDGLITNYVKYDQASFQARPPNTLCTCVTWLSATEIAVGCANGFLAIWDIASSPEEEDRSMPSTRLIPIPLLYIYLHQSYILAISCGYPSLPNFIATSSMDGHLRLTDLRAPTTDFVLSNRSRVAPSTIAFSDPLSSFISTEEYDSIRVFPIRVFHIPITIARADNFATCISVGHFHPCVLVGSTDGGVISTNPLRRILYRRIKSHQQTVFRHEWVRRGGGTSRLTEGYKIVTLDFSQQKAIGLEQNFETGQEEDRKQKEEGKEKEGIVISTVREEEEGVTQIEWNPNLVCGGWVAVGWGSGLVRVQDLAL